jgi:hypothetical protein
LILPELNGSKNKNSFKNDEYEEINKSIIKNKALNDKIIRLQLL